jgi:hypothetical protein
VHTGEEGLAVSSTIPPGPAISIVLPKVRGKAHSQHISVMGFIILPVQLAAACEWEDITIMKRETMDIRKAIPKIIEYFLQTAASFTLKEFP